MDKTTLEALEYPQILSELARFARTPLGGERLLALRPMRDKASIDAAFTTLAETFTLMKETGGLSLGGVEDIRALLDEASPEGAMLTPSKLSEVLSTVEALVGLGSALTATFKRSYPITSKEIAALSDSSPVSGELGRVLDGRGAVSDGASDELRRVRKDLSRSRERARKFFEALSKQTGEDIADTGGSLFTVRDDRFVLCVSAAYHSRMKGIVHGRSSSGSTFYIEPFEGVELNNSLSLLKREEEAEEAEVLRRATAVVAAASDDMRGDLEVVARLDAVAAKARFMEHLGGVIPEIGGSEIGGPLIAETSGLEMNGPEISGTGAGVPETGEAAHSEVNYPGARHPLLVFKEKAGGDRVVPVDLVLKEGTAVLVLSGANAGGKTVALKTLGLLTLMCQSAIAVPASEGARTVIFKEVLADIGDRQDIGESLSTFSAHLKRTGEILDAAGPASLVLIDEVGAGTDPTEAAALALTVLEELRDKGGVAVVTTHLSAIKAYAHTSESFENVSVLFNEDTHSPLYRLRYGAPGASLAITVAESLGMPAHIVERARERLDGEEGAYARSMDLLEQDRAALDKERVEMEAVKRLMEETTEKRSAALDRLRGDRKKMLQRARVKVEELIETAKGEVAEISKRLGEGRQKGSERAAAKALGDTGRRFSARLTTDDDRSYEPRVGDMVAMRGSSAAAKVIYVDGGGKKAELLVGGMKVWAGWDRLAMRDGSKPSQRALAFSDVGSDLPGAPTSVKVIGMRRDEAVEAVARALDKAHMDGLERLEVVHGKGTGRLRVAIGEYLEASGVVKAFHIAEESMGGAGVTIVELA